MRTDFISVLVVEYTTPFIFCIPFPDRVAVIDELRLKGG
jgi:hypothetical protein